jgi:hypothetical protein
MRAYERRRVLAQLQQVARLAACVFYAAIFRQSPVGLSYREGLSDAEATTLQQVAAHTALEDPSKGGKTMTQWLMPNYPSSRARQGSTLSRFPRID